MYVCMYVSPCGFLHVLVKHMYVCTNIYGYASTYICVYIYICLFIYFYISRRTMCAYACTGTHICGACTFMYIHIHIHIYIHTVWGGMCLYIYIYIFILLLILMCWVRLKNQRPLNHSHGTSFCAEHAHFGMLRPRRGTDLVLAAYIALIYRRYTTPNTPYTFSFRCLTDCLLGLTRDGFQPHIWLKFLRPAVALSRLLHLVVQLAVWGFCVFAYRCNPGPCQP